jgi:hypothetical protein
MEANVNSDVDKIYYYLQCLRKEWGTGNISVTLAASGSGYFEDDEGNKVLTWNNIAEGWQKMRMYWVCIYNRVDYDEYLRLLTVDN